MSIASLIANAKKTKAWDEEKEKKNDIRITPQERREEEIVLPEVNADSGSPAKNTQSYVNKTKDRYLEDDIASTITPKVTAKAPSFSASEDLETALSALRNSSDTVNAMYNDLGKRRSALGSLAGQIDAQSANLEHLASNPLLYADSNVTRNYASAYRDYQNYTDLYRSAVEQYNTMLDQFKTTAEQYNADMKSYRDLAGRGLDLSTEYNNYADTLDQEAKDLTEKSTKLLKMLSYGAVAPEKALETRDQAQQYQDQAKAKMDEAAAYRQKAQGAVGSYYAIMPYADDYDTLSKPVTSRGGNARNAGPTSDNLYNFINDLEGAREHTKQMSLHEATEYGDMQPYSYMTDDEIATYNYIYAKNGKEDADKFLDYIHDSLNSREGKAIYDSMSGVEKGLYWIPQGLDQWASGMQQLFHSDALPTSAIQYAGQNVQQGLQELGLTDEEKQRNAEIREAVMSGDMTAKEADKEIKSSVWGKLAAGAYGLGTTISNMAPSIMVSYMTGGLLGAAVESGTISAATAGRIAGATGSALMGGSAGGNAYNMKLKEGWTKDQARTYGMLVAASESLLQYFLGGIDQLGGALAKKGEKAVSDVLLEKVLTQVSKMDSVFARTALEFGSRITVKGLSEGIEEGLQEILEPVFANLIHGDDIDIDWGNVTESFIMGFLASGILDAPGTMVDSVTAAKSYRVVGDVVRKNGDAFIDEVIQSGIELGEKSEAYALATDIQQKLNDGKTVSSRELGELYVKTMQKAIEKADAAEQTNEAAQQAPTEETDNKIDLRTYQENQQADREQRAAQAKTEFERSAILAGMKDSEISRIQRVSNALGTNVRAYYEAPDASGTIKNGYFDRDTGILYINAASENPSTQILSHEFTHQLEQTEGYSALAKQIIDRLTKEETIDERRAELRDLYQKAGIALDTDGSTAKVDAEIVAEYIEKEILTDESRIRELVQDRTFGQRILDQIDKLLAKFGNENAQERVWLTNLRNNISAAMNEASNTTEAEPKGLELPTIENTAPNTEAGESTETDNKIDLQRAEPQTDEQRVDDVMKRTMDMMEFSISKLPDGRKYVKADRQVVFGSDPEAWSRQLEDYINNKIRHGEDVQLITDDGDVLTLTADTAGKVSSMYNGYGSRLEEDAFERKVNAGSHIDELAQVSTRGNKDVIDYGGRHGDSASGGWNYRTAYFQDYDGKYYRVRLSVQRGDNGNVVYNIGDMQERSLPKLTGSSVNDGALNGETSSGTNIAEEAPNVKRGNEQNSDRLEDNGVTLIDDSASRQYSLSTWTPTERDSVVSALVKKGFDEETVRKWANDVNSIAAIIADDKARLDFNAADNQTFLKKNQEYTYTADASTLCDKRRPYQGTFNEIQHRLPDAVLTSDDLIRLQNMMKEMGYTAPCGVCYVESRRRHLGRYAQEWLDGYDGEYIPSLDEVTTTDGLERLRHEHPQTYTDFVKAMKKIGVNNPKVVELRTAYRGEVRRLSPSTIAKLIRIGGLRLQSFSDFETPHLLDMMQLVMDMASKGLTSQAYTKVPNFAWVFGDTGIKINLSLIAEGNGLNPDGTLRFSSTEGMDIDEAMKLREAYGDNVGTILVGVNDAHILAAMADDRIDFIIPFHKSGWGTAELEAMGMSEYEDYTPDQNEKDMATGKVPEGGNIPALEYWDFDKTGKENAEEYLRLCAEQNRIPKFSRFLVDNGDGSFSLQPDGSTDGYWKTLTDFRMYNNEGKGAPQRAVTPNFNMEEATRVLGEYEGGADTLPVAQDVVDRFIDEYNKKNNNSYSISTEDVTAKDNYTYDKLISKGSINVVPLQTREIPTKGKKLDSSAIAREARKKASTLYVQEAGGINRAQKYVFVPDISANVLFQAEGIKHGLQGNSTNASAQNTAAVTYDLADILRNSIAINELKGREHEPEVKLSYVLMGFARSQNGQGYLVRSTIDHYDRNKSILASVEIFDVIKGAKAKKIESEVMRDLSEKSGWLSSNASDSSITVADLLEIVKDNYPEFLSKDVIKHYGLDTEQAPDVVYSISRNDQPARNSSELLDLLTDMNPDNQRASREDIERMRQKDLDDLWKTLQEAGDILEPRTNPDEKVSTKAQKKQRTAGEKFREGWSFFKRKMIDSGEAVTRVGKAVNDPHLYHYYNMARASSNAATSMIVDEQTDIYGRRVGKGLNEIMDTIREKGEDHYKKLQLYLFHMHNIDRMSLFNQDAIDSAQAAYAEFKMTNPELARYTDKQIEEMSKNETDPFYFEAQEYMDRLNALRHAENTRNKPVFGFDVSAEDSRAIADQLLRENPEFADEAQQIYDYIENLLRYRVDSGLITEDDYQTLKQVYPHYVPTFRTFENETTDTRQKNKVQIGSTIKRATGGTEKLMPLHKALAQQTMSVVREGSKNRFGQRLLNSNAQKTAPDLVRHVQEYESNFAEDTFDTPESQREELAKGNTFIVREGGKQWEMEVSPAMFEAVKALSPDANENNFMLRIIRGGNNLFKELVTGYNPTFLVRNFMRDLQDAGIYSKDLSKFAQQYPQAVAEIAKDGEYWRQYKALGGTYSTIFDYDTGETEKSGWLKRNTVGRIEALNMAIEQAPRLAEFMATVKNAEADHGTVTMDDLMEAMYNAADVTVNFGRSGSVGKILNANFVPFLNPGIQGFDKMIRNVTETKGAKNWARLAIKAAVLGIAPTLLNALLYHDEDDWDEIKDRDKDIYYLFKIGDHTWLKLPKGRTLSLLGMAADRAIDLAKGEDVDWGGVINTAASQVAPANPLENNIFQAAYDTHLFNKDNPGETWYGSDIESQRLQGYAPGERYDASTDIVSKWLGKTFNLSPKKINYLLDQYSGVVGDALLPLLTPTAERDMFSAAFTLDTAKSTRLSSDFYEMADELQYAKNGPEATGADAVAYRYWNKQNSAISEVNKAIREIEADETLSDKDKRELTKVQYLIRNELMKNAMDSYEKYADAAERYYYDSDIEDEDDRKDYAYREANREILGAEYALKTYNKKVYETAQKMEQKHSISYDDFYDFYFAKQAITAKGYQGTNEKRDLIAGLDMTDAQKEALYKEYISDSRDGDIEAFKAAGLNFNSFLSAQNEYAAIDAAGGGAGQKRTEFARWVYDQNMTPAQRDTVLDSFTFYSHIPAEQGKYEDFLGLGIDDNDAYDISVQLSKLEPLEDKKTVSGEQKWHVIVDSGLSAEDQLKALEAVTDESQYRKFNVAYSMDVEPSVYVTARETMPLYDTDGNGSYKNAEIEAAIDSLGYGAQLPGGNAVTLTNAQRAVLWQLLTGSTSAKNNPYSSSVGWEVVNAINAAKEAAKQEQAEESTASDETSTLTLPTAGTTQTGTTTTTPGPLKLVLPS